MNFVLVTNLNVTRVGRVVAQAVSRRPPTAKARVRSRVSPCGICGGQWHWDRFFPVYFGFPLSISFHQFSITRKRTKNNNNHHHLHHRVAQEASMLRFVRSVCCRALHRYNNYSAIFKKHNIIYISQILRSDKKITKPLCRLYYVCMSV
jgi:hypothetical protein